MGRDIVLYADIDLGGPTPHRCDVWRGFNSSNLIPVAHEVGVYDVMWEPTEHGIATAEQMIEPLEQGLLRLGPTRSRTDDSLWRQKGLANCIEQLIDACKLSPKASVRTGR